VAAASLTFLAGHVLAGPLPSSCLSSSALSDMSDSVRFFRWSDVPLERVTDSLTRKLITGDRMMLAHVFLDKGCIVPKHSHENEQLTYILEGALRFWIGDEESQVIEVHAGEVLHIPSNVPHKALALEDTLDVDIFSPPRADWLSHTDSYFHQK
jgi:quercetin dioxygenase-like cupin family protein